MLGIGMLRPLSQVSVVENAPGSPHPLARSLYIPQEHQEIKLGEPRPISLGIRSNTGRNQQAASGRLINCFSEQTGDDAKSMWTIYGTAGLVNFGAALVGGGIRAALEVGGVLYTVAGRNIYAVDAAGTATLIGGLPTDGPVKLVRNRRLPPQIGVVSDGFYEVIDTGTNTVTEISDPDLVSPLSIDFLDGYFIMPFSNARFMITGIDEATSIDGLDQGVCDAFPDEIVQVAVLEREIVFFGTKSCEWHGDTGDADFPITRIHASEIGCLAANSVAKVDTDARKTLIWVAPDHTVRMMNGYGGQVISTHEIAKLIKELHESGNISQLTGFAWADSGRFYYALSCDSWTRVWNSSTQNWHDQKSYGRNDWRVGLVVPFADKLIAGDKSTGQLYVMSFDAYDEAGEPLIMELITPSIQASPYSLRFNALYLSAAKGVGLNSTQEHLVDPEIMVSWSNDNGYTYSAERTRKLGRLGQTTNRIPPIRRMGTCKEGGRIYRFRISAPVERMLLSAALDLDKLST